MKTISTITDRRKRLIINCEHIEYIEETEEGCEIGLKSGTALLSLTPFRQFIEEFYGNGENQK